MPETTPPTEVVDGSTPDSTPAMLSTDDIDELNASGCGEVSRAVDSEYYTALQQDLEVYRPFVWVGFFADIGNGNMGSYSASFNTYSNKSLNSMTLDHMMDLSTNKFRYMKGFEHKLFGTAGGEAVMIKFYDEGGIKMPTILKGLLSNIATEKQLDPTRPNPYNWVCFQYGYHSESLVSSSSAVSKYESELIDDYYGRRGTQRGQRWVSAERMLVITKVEIAFDEGGTSYIVYGTDPGAAAQQSTPLKQMPPNTRLDHVIRELLADLGIPFCSSKAYQEAVKQNPNNFIVNTPYTTALNKWSCINQLIKDFSKQGEYTLHMCWDSEAARSFHSGQMYDLRGGTSVNSGKSMMQLHLLSTPEAFQKSMGDDTKASENQLAGWQKDGLIVNAFEKNIINSREAGRGGVVISFKPTINYMAAAAMQLMFVALNPLVRGKIPAGSASPTKSLPGQKNNTTNQATSAGAASNAMGDNRLTKETVGGDLEKSENEIRQLGDINIAGMEAELECLGMPLYDDRGLLVTNKRFVKLDVRMPYYLPINAEYMTDFDWTSTTLNQEAMVVDSNKPGFNNRNQLLSGWWWVKDISHRIDESLGYVTVYSLIRMVPSGQSYVKAYGGGGYSISQ